MVVNLTYFACNECWAASSEHEDIDQLVAEAQAAGWHFDPEDPDRQLCASCRVEDRPTARLDQPAGEPVGDPERQGKRQIAGPRKQAAADGAARNGGR